MDELGKMKLFVEKGWKYNPETGEIFSHTGKVITGKRSGYIRIGIRIDRYTTYLIRAHRLAYYIMTGNLPDNDIDHINRIRNDNRWCNLRNVTRQENNWNRSDVIGITFDISRNRWRSQIVSKGKNIFLGRFNTEEEAHNAYLEAKKIYHQINK